MMVFGSGVDDDDNIFSFTFILLGLPAD